MEIQTLKCDGYSVRYFSFGAEHGQPLVIIPGVAIKSVMESADLIAAQYGKMAEKRRIFVIDRRTDIDMTYSVNDMAEDVISVLDSLSVKNADLYGVSQGGLIAQIIAVRRGDLVRKLVLCSTAAQLDKTAAGILDQWKHLAETGDKDSLMLSFAENVYTPAYVEKYRSAFLEFGKSVTADELHRFSIMTGSMDTENICEKLSGLRCPVLVICGENDRIFGTDQAKQLAELTHGELHIFKEQAHGVYDENPDVMRLIEEFLEKSEEA